MDPLSPPTAPVPAPTVRQPPAGTATAPAPRPRPIVLGRYRLLERIGAGAFGSVWRAVDERLRREVAVKVVPRERAGGARAEREALAAARLRHPAIVALHEAGADRHAYLLVTELVRGSTLAELVAAWTLDDEAVARIGLALCDALAHAHAHGVVHRDVKPSNVLVPADDVDGGVPAKLADFGIAQLADAELLTRSDDVLGTLAYMAPEQAEGGRVTAAADVYALGVVLFEAFSGSNPVRGRTAAETARRIGTRLPSLADERPDLPFALAEAVDAAVEPAPGERAQLDELRETLATALGSGALAPSRWRRRTGARERPRDPMPTAAQPSPAAVLPTEAGLEADAEWDAGATRPRLPARLVAGAAAAAVTGAALALAPGPPAPALPVAAIVAALAVAVAPRAAWLLAAAGLALYFAVPPVDLPGVAVLIVAAALPVPLALPRASTWWSLPAATPLLAVPGLAAAFPAFAGQARTAARRLALGALGWWWLCLAAALAHANDAAGARGDAPLSAATPPMPAPAGWTGDGAAAFADVVVPLAIAPGTLLAAAAFGLAAALLPVLIPGRSFGADLVGAGVWLAVLAGALAGVAAVAAPAGAPGLHAESVLGAAVGAVVAVAVRAVSGDAGPDAVT